MSDTPVEVQFTPAGCLNYPCRTPAGYWFIPYFGTLRAKQSVFGLVKTGPDAAEKLTTGDLRKIAERYVQLGNELQRLYLDGLVPITSGKKK
jgi:hypothetical protein